MADIGFLPDGARARRIDLRMRCSLADSLDYISNEIRGLIPFDPPALAHLTSSLRQGIRYPPSTFGLYAELVPALEGGDIAGAEQLLAELLAERPLPPGWQLLSLDDPAIVAQAPRYQRLMDSDPDTRFALLPPPPAVATAFRQRLHRAHGLLYAAAPELAAEFDALVSQVIMVTGDPAAEYQFDGGSSYMLWGGLFLNARSRHDDVALVEVMAHESAHLLLFGHACDEALVNNDDTTLYESPLRDDPRPMDGIYHATYVSARMHWAMSRLLDSSLLDESARRRAEAARQADLESFIAGYGIVERHADLTATGRAVMAAAKSYIDSVNHGHRS